MNVEERGIDTGHRAQRLSLRGLNKSFGAVHVVKDLSIDV
ncbi:MAG: ABC transporter ATP-binding protein, partial [Mesorhizobium sp.]